VSRERSVLQLPAVRAAARTPALVRALAAVDRDWFLPQPPPPLTDEPVWITTGSTASQPSLVVRMLEQLRVQPGQRVLELGTGSGYNAALLASLVGRTGRVTTVEVDPHLAARARRLLDRYAEHPVDVVTGDGADLAWPDPFDRIIVTCALHELPEQWLTMLASDGFLVVPLALRANVQVCGAFVREGDCFRSTSSQPVIFVSHRDRDERPSIPSASLVGPGASTLHLAGEIDVGRRADMVARQLLSIGDAAGDAAGDATERVVAAGFPLVDAVLGLAPWVASHDADVVSLTGPQPARVGLPSLVPGRVHTFGIADDADVAFLSSPRHDQPGLAIAASGPGVEHRLRDHVVRWIDAGRPRSSAATLRYRFGASRPADRSDDAVINKANGTLTVEWPAR
jgi:protein-L-isoaspartate(D-aspartate) O-methyltransferase